MKDYHCCATCIHYEIHKGANEKFFCGRLGFSTNPKYQFKCWTPKDLRLTNRTETDGWTLNLTENKSLIN